MALYAFDGTWNEEKNNDTTHENTNVARLFDAYHARSGGDDVYEQGMMLKAKGAGLPFTADDIAALKPDFKCAPRLHDLPPFWRPMRDGDLRHYTVQAMDKCRPLPATGPVEDAAAEMVAQQVGQGGVSADAQAGV